MQEINDKIEKLNEELLQEYARPYCSFKKCYDMQDKINKLKRELYENNYRNITKEICK